MALTIDTGLQQVAETAFGDRRGALVALEPSTGAVLAMVSEPGFDPNLFVDGIDPQSWDALNNSPDHPLNNRAIAGLYPPGSTLKPYLALAALELGKRTPKSTIVDPGYFMFGGRRFRDDKPGGHGVVDMYKALVASCDTYFYMPANDLGLENIAHFVGQFGFGAKTGIDIEGEATGVLPSPQWKRRHFKKPGQQKWYPGETISIGIGQGYNAYTPIQMALAVATLAENGVEAGAGDRHQVGMGHPGAVEAVGGLAVLVGPDLLQRRCVDLRVAARGDECRHAADGAGAQGHLNVRAGGALQREPHPFEIDGGGRAVHRGLSFRPLPATLASSSG